MRLLQSNLFLLFLLTIVIMPLKSCKKALEDEQAENERSLIESFISKNNWSYTKNDGVYHIIRKPSFGYQVALGDTVSFTFTGYTLSGIIFETNDIKIARLEKLDTTVRSFSPIKLIVGNSNLIDGITNGLLAIRGGEEATIIFPSTLGYGKNVMGPVESNSPLAFDIELISVNGAKIQEEKSYISSLNLSSSGFTEHSESGLFYKFSPEGVGSLPTIRDTVYGWYKGMLFDGTVIDEVTTSNKMIVLSSKDLVEGVRQGFLLTKEVGVSDLVLPSFLAFGNTGNQQVKPYETVKYQIRLDSIKHK